MHFQFMITLQDKYQYAKSDIIGQGSYGEVYVARNLINNEQCVLKIEREYEYMTLERLQNEAIQIEQLRHPNIVRGYDHFIFENEFYIVMQYYEHQDLATYLAKTPNPSQQQVLKWIVQVASALNYLHSQQVIHRDVKIQNIFIDAELNAYLGDFGTARKLSRQFASTFIGTPQTMAPEVVAEKPYCCKSDMWSIGCIIYELIEGRPAFQAKNPMAVIKLISEGAYEAPTKADQFMRKIIDSLLVINPTKRWDSYQLCKYLEEELRAYNLPSPIVVENVTFTRQLNDAERTLIVQFNNIQHAATQTMKMENNIFMSQTGVNSSCGIQSYSQQSQFKTFNEITKQKMYVKLLNLLNDEDNLYELIVAQMLIYSGESQEAVSMFLNVQEEFLASTYTDIITFMLQKLLQDVSKVQESQILVDAIGKITYQENNVAEQSTQLSASEHI